KLPALFPVSNRMRLPPYSTRAARPQSMVSEPGLPNESYRMVTRSRRSLDSRGAFGVSAGAITANNRTITARAHIEICPQMPGFISVPPRPGLVDGCPTNDPATLIEVKSVDLTPPQGASNSSRYFN